MSDNEGAKGKASAGWSDRERVRLPHPLASPTLTYLARLPRQPDRALRHKVELQGMLSHISHHRDSS